MMQNSTSEMVAFCLHPTPQKMEGLETKKNSKNFKKEADVTL